MSMKLFARISIAWLLTLGLSAAAHAQSQYVVSANAWGAAQNKAVADAGGTVKFSHPGAGVAVVESSSPGFLSKLRKSSAIASAELDMVVQWQQPTVGATIEANFTNPPNNDRFFNNVQWAPQAIDAPAAWALGCTGEGVRVAVLDGGIWNVHPDLAPNLDVARSTSFTTGAYNTDVGGFWHGTHVAGIIAAIDNVTNANSGVIGVAPKATIVGVKVLHGGSGSFGGVIQGILYAATPIAQGGAGADIINMSLGATFPRGGGNTGAGALIASMNKAVNFATSRGVLVVSAAGNDGLDLDHSKSYISVPAESGSGIAVSSTGPLGFALGATNFDRPASYTNYGTSAIAVAAPGGDFDLPGNAPCTLPTNGAPVTIPCWAFDMVLSTNVGGWAWAAGTSMAAPAASAVAAMIKQKNPNISVGALKAALQNSALDRGKGGADPFYGKGWVNALAACQH
jgi:lantibiotic leader peptide-processing serine protease